MGKKINDLTLRSSVIDSVNIPADDGVQTYRVTAAQFWTYIWGKITAVATISAAGTTLTSANAIVLLNPTSAPFTQALPAVATSSGWRLTFKNIATNSNQATLDPNASETIDADTTLVLDQYDAVTLYCNGSKWLIL